MPIVPYQIMPAIGSDQADEWMRLGFEAQTSGNLPQAQQRYNQCLRLDPRHAMALNNLAIVFAQSNLLNEALLTIERAELCDGKHNVIPVNWAIMAHECDRIDEAVAKARRALELTPDDLLCQLALAMIITGAGYPDEAIALYNKILDKDPKQPAAGPNACFVQTLTNATPQELLAQRKRWYEANRYEGKIERHANDKDPERILRVGYVGGDFKSHSAAFIFSRVLWHHTEAVEMYLYSSLPVDAEKDPKTKRFQEKGQWRDITQMTDEQVSEQIRKDKIDILVDLAGHTNGGRLGVFTHKPAPIQVTAWGFAHGTGLPEIDYFFADPIAIPPMERQHYAEKIWDLPCIVTIEPPDEYGLKASSMAPFKKNGYITFGCYTRYEKISDDCLNSFAEILRRVPDSKLEFKDNAFRRPYSIRRVMNAMQDIAPERLLFSVATSHMDHMLAYQQCDLFLNPWPHSSGVVTLECLYMGVPMVTMYGTQAAGRTAASVLSVLGHENWIARRPAEYVEAAVRMAEDTKLLSEVRKTLRDELVKSPVVNGYVEKVEEAYRQMWRKWCES